MGWGNEWVERGRDEWVGGGMSGLGGRDEWVGRGDEWVGGEG